MKEQKIFPQNILSYPDFISIGLEKQIIESTQNNSPIMKNDVSLSFELTDENLDVFITAKETPLNFIKLKWNRPIPENAKVYGDTWERGYGDLEWTDISKRQEKDAFMPWYFFLNAGNKTTGIGVMVRPAALCYWKIDKTSITLYADIQNGGKPVHLNGRTIKIASIVTRQYTDCSSFEACQEFCKLYTAVITGIMLTVTAQKKKF